MKNFKRTLCAALAAVLLATLLPTAAAAAENTALLTDGEAGFLKYLGILTDDAPDFGAAVTRGELVYMAARVCDLDDSAGDGRQIFVDVPADSPYYSYIYAMVEMGAVSGDNGFFRPDEPASFADACKIFTVIMGYVHLSNFVNYVSIGKQTGIANGVAEGDVLTRGQAARMAYNCLHLGMCKMTMVGGSVNTYSVDPDYTVLECYHHMIAYRGIVEGVEGTTLTHRDNTCVENQVSVDGKVFNYPAAPELLGKPVIYYLDSDGYSRDIACLYVDERHVNIVTVDAASVIGIGDGMFKYYSDLSGTSVRSLRLDSMADLIYNGAAYPEYTQEDLKPACGNLTFIDNNTDGVFDVVHVTSYTFMIVRSANAVNNVINGKYPDVMLGSVEDDDTIVRVYKNGAPAPMSAVLPDTVIAVRESKNTYGGKIINVDLTIPELRGNIISVFPETITVGAYTFETAENMISDRSVRAGETVTVYTFGNMCVGITHTSTTGNQTAYLVKAAKEDETFNTRFVVRLVNSAHKMIDLDCASKLKLDGVLMNMSIETDKVMEALQTSAARTNNQNAEWPLSQLIRYRLNSEGKISEIDTNTYDPENEEENSLRLDYIGTNMYYPTYRSFHENNVDGELIASFGNTSEAWNIPTSSRETEEYYYTGSFARATYPVEFYNIDPKSHVAGTIVSYAGNPALSTTRLPLLVTDVGEIMTSDGYITKEITALTTGSAATYKLPQDLSGYEVAKGDLIRTTENNTGASEFIDTWYRIGEIPNEMNRIKISGPGTDLSNFEASVRVACGTALYKDGQFMTHTTSLPSDVGGVEGMDNLANYITSSAVYYLYDLTAQKPEVQKVTIDDIITYNENPAHPDMVFMVTQSGTLRYVYAVRY